MPVLFLRILSRDRLTPKWLAIALSLMPSRALSRNGYRAHTSIVPEIGCDRLTSIGDGQVGTFLSFDYFEYCECFEYRLYDVANEGETR